MQKASDISRNCFQMFQHRHFATHDKVMFCNLRNGAKRTKSLLDFELKHSLLRIRQKMNLVTFSRSKIFLAWC